MSLIQQHTNILFYTSCIFFLQAELVINQVLFGVYGISTFVGYLMPNPFLYK